MAGRVAKPPDPVAAVSLAATGDPAVDRVLKQAEQALLELQQQIRAITTRVAALEAGEAGE